MGLPIGLPGWSELIVFGGVFYVIIGILNFFVLKMGYLFKYKAFIGKGVTLGIGLSFGVCVYSAVRGFM